MGAALVTGLSSTLTCSSSCSTSDQSSMSTKSFPRNPALSNAKFENYKLSAPTASTRAFALPGAAVTQARVQHGRTTLSAREVGSRIRHDHLNICWSGWLGWVDENWEIWTAKLGQVRARHLRFPVPCTR